MDGFASLFSAFGLASAAGLNAYVPLLTVGLVALIEFTVAIGLGFLVADRRRRG